MGIPVKHRILRFVGHQQWLRGRDTILRTFSHPDHQKPHPFETQFFSHSYSGTLANFIDWSVFYYGAYAIRELRLLIAIADALRAQGKPVNFFDVGANIGHHTLCLSGQADQVFSFEPFSVVRDEMLRKLNHAKVANVTVFPVALGDRSETRTFFPPTGANQGTGTLGDKIPDNASTDNICVQVVRGDEFFTANQLPPISLLKIDVEGYEAKVLEGLQQTLWHDRPPILMEIQPEPEADVRSLKTTTIEDLLYPDHLLFSVGVSRGHYTLSRFSPKEERATLVLPAELAGIIPGTNTN